MNIEIGRGYNVENFCYFPDSYGKIQLQENAKTGIVLYYIKNRSKS